jgi:hypothetical protein
VPPFVDLAVEQRADREGGPARQQFVARHRLLTNQAPHREEDEELTGWKEAKLALAAARPAIAVSNEELCAVGDELASKEGTL